MTSIIQKKPPAPRPDSKPSVTPPKPVTQLPVTPPKPVMPSRPPIVRPGPMPSPKQPPTRGGTPITAKNAPGYRSAGVPIMPSSQARGFNKGGSASKRADGIATKGKTKGRMM